MTSTRTGRRCFSSFSPSCLLTASNNVIAPFGSGAADVPEELVPLPSPGPLVRSAELNISLVDDESRQRLHDHSGFHDPGDVLHHRDIVERVRRHRYQIGELARLSGPKVMVEG